MIDETNQTDTTDTPKERFIEVNGTYLSGRKRDVYEAFLTAGQSGTWLTPVATSVGLRHQNLGAIVRELSDRGYLEEVKPAGDEKPSGGRRRYYRACFPVTREVSTRSRFVSPAKAEASARALERHRAFKERLYTEGLPVRPEDFGGGQ